jgi:predicted DNA-binding transcriptional regulator YafY
MPIKASQVSFNEGVLRLAVVHHRTVEFRYEKGPDKPIESRQLEPKSIHVAAGGDMSFVGYDPDRENTRSFRVDRIKGDVRFV